MYFSMQEQSELATRAWLGGLGLPPQHRPQLGGPLQVQSWLPRYLIWQLGLVELAASSLVAPLGSRQPGRGTAD